MWKGYPVYCRNEEMTLWWLFQLIQEVQESIAQCECQPTKRRTERSKNGDPTEILVSNMRASAPHIFHNPK